MKVVCKICGKLEDENEAIKMNQVEIRTIRMDMADAEFMQFHAGEYQIYGAVCVSCYEGWKEYIRNGRRKNDI